MTRVILIFTALLSAITYAWCAEPDSLVTDDIGLEEIVVKSFRRDNGFRNAPVAAIVIGNAELQNRQATSTKDFAQFTPNMFMPDYGSRLTSPVYIRGIGSKINSPSVGLYVDGIPYFEKSAFDFDINEVESVEILRGPQGTLYGRNTMGGIINVRTRSPLMYRGTTVASSAGNYGYLNGQFSHYGAASENRLGYAISANTSHYDGYFVNRATGQEADAMNTGSARLQFDYRAMQNLALKWTSLVDRLDQGGYPYGVVDQAGKTGAVDYSDPSSYRRTMVSNGLSALYSGKQFVVNSRTSFQYLSDRQSIDQDFSPARLYFVVQDQKQLTVTQEITVKSDDRKHYKWLLGGFAFYQHINNELVTNLQTANYSTTKFYDNPTSGVSLYHQSVFDNLLADGLSVTLGMRFDYEHASDDYIARRDTAGQSNLTDAFFSRLDFNQFTPKIAMQYTFTDNKTVYISATKGYKTGGFNTSFVRNEDRSFEPEYSWNYETGFKGSLFGNRLHVDACLFYIDWENQQIYQPLPVVAGQTYLGGHMLKNAGRSESKGVELSLQIKPSKALNIKADWGYTSAVFRKYRKDNSTDYSGRFIPFAPRNTASAGFDLTIPAFSRKFDCVTLSMNYQGIDCLYWNEDNSAFQPYYGLLNGRLSVVHGNLTVSLWAKNLTDTQYSAYYFESQGKRFAQRGRPFTAGVTVEMKMIGN
jgi:outer membrane receptor protein involved in Fe transport